MADKGAHVHDPLKRATTRGSLNRELVTLKACQREALKLRDEDEEGVEVPGASSKTLDPAAAAGHRTRSVDG